jgi:hypothetical protein
VPAPLIAEMVAGGPANLWVSITLNGANAPAAWLHFRMPGTVIEVSAATGTVPFDSLQWRAIIPADVPEVLRKFVEGYGSPDGS